MKPNTRRLYLALMGASLLLSLNAVSAQRHRSAKPQKPKAQTPTPTPQPPTLKGTYTLDDPAAATKTVNDAIAASVKGMWVGGGDARTELEKANLPPPRQITISYTSAEVTIETDVSGPLQTANGTTRDWTWHGNTYKVSTKWENGQLVRTLKGDGRWRVNTYSLGAGGKTLNMQVTANGKKWGVSLKRDLVYVLHYSRTTN